MHVDVTLLDVFMLQCHNAHHQAHVYKSEAGGYKDLYSVMIHCIFGMKKNLCDRKWNYYITFWGYCESPCILC